MPLPLRASTASRLALAAAAVIIAITASPAPAAADPPSWAPAHGWRKKHDREDRDEVVVEHRRAPVCGGIDNQAVGSTGGAAAGAILGNAIGHGSDERLAASVAGAAGGALLGGVAGRAADRDRGC
jgi:uncharacterized protein YcfJ